MPAAFANIVTLPSAAPTPPAAPKSAQAMIANAAPAAPAAPAPAPSAAPAAPAAPAPGAPAASSPTAPSTAPAQPKTAPPMPTTELYPPENLLRRLSEAMSKGLADSDEWMKQNGDTELFKFPYFVQDRVQPPPTGDAEAAELKELHAIVPTRTPEGIARADWLAEYGMFYYWENVLQDYLKTATPAMAKRATQLLHDTQIMTEGVGLAMKNKFNRKRPYITDPTLKTTVTQHKDNPSYPSGHTYGMFACALVMATLMPNRATEFMKVAAEMAYARMYGGVHYSSDVVAGAYVGSLIGATVLKLAAQRDAKVAASASKQVTAGKARPKTAPTIHTKKARKTA